MNGGQLPTNQLHDINWGALDHASRASQLMSCNYYVCARVCVTMHASHVPKLCYVTTMCKCACACACECECECVCVRARGYMRVCVWARACTLNNFTMRNLIRISLSIFLSSLYSIHVHVRIIPSPPLKIVLVFLNPSSRGIAVTTTTKKTIEQENYQLKHILKAVTPILLLTQLMCSCLFQNCTSYQSLTLASWLPL